MTHPLPDVHQQLRDPHALLPVGSVEMEPQRRTAPGEAAWVPELSAWVHGESDETGAPIGTWILWRHRPYLEAAQRIEVDFEAGARTAWREYVEDRPDELATEYRYEPGGAIILHRSYRDGRPELETEERMNGTTAERRFHPDGAVKRERVHRQGEPIAERWFDPNGTVTAEVGDAAWDDGPVETWRALDRSGAVIAEGRVAAGLDDGPCGEWRLPGSPETRIVFDGLGLGRRHDLGALALALGRWHSLVIPADLEAPLAELSKERPALATTFKGVIAGDPLACDLARAAIQHQILDAVTITPDTVDALASMCAHLEDAEPPLLELLVSVTSSEGYLYVAKLLKDRYGAEGEPDSYAPVQAALTREVETLARLSATGSEASRYWAVHLLALTPGAEAAAALRRWLDAEAGDRTAIAGALLCLALDEDSTDQARLERFLIGYDSLLSSCAGVTWLRRGMSPAVTAVLAVTECGEEYRGLLFAGDDALADARDAIRVLPEAERRTCEEALTLT